ncbi:hypothetical protein EDB85DRAFT_1622222 [Lactarius pseudohatsudake]|nr:hypothetical protein EDB85DRAFT_1622222 [Lactarius pseudohatsudake]
MFLWSASVCIAFTHNCTALTIGDYPDHPFPTDEGFNIPPFQSIANASRSHSPSITTRVSPPDRHSTGIHGTTPRARPTPHSDWSRHPQHLLLGTFVRNWAAVLPRPVQLNV